MEHHRAGRLREAEQVYRQILETSPLDGNALHLLGLVIHHQGRHEAALESFRRAIDVRPGSPVFWANLSAVYGALGRNREAVDAAVQALRLNPNHGEAYCNLGCALQALGDLDGAAANFRWAIQINPGYVKAHSNLGVALREQGKLDEAARSLQKALELNPSYAEAYRNLGAVFRQQARFDEAIRSLQKALEINPGFADAHKNLGLTLLQVGDFEAGWAHYEWRWQTGHKIFEPRNFAQPPWDGRPLEGKSLLMHAEQGLGDTLQFVRYARLVRPQGGQVLLECQRPLCALLSGCPGVDRLVARGDELPQFDCHVPLFSLPRLLGTRLGNVPAEVPYLVAREDLVRRWRDRLSDCNGFKVGICWQGSPEPADDRQRSVALARFAPLSAVPGVDLISLQKGAGTEQLAAVRFAVRALGAELDEASGAFMDTAAVMRNLDLVVTVDTAVAHLAGALGVPVWVALVKVPDWRWLLDREDSPWYPTMRLFRQETAGDWGPVFGRIAAALREHLASREQSPPREGAAAPSSETRTGALTVEVSAGDLIDKIAILEIKRARIDDPGQRANVCRELAGLVAVRDREVAATTELTGLAAELKEVNEALWQIADEIRDCERRRDFGPAFIALARSVYQQNDRRAALKRRINDLLGSQLVEEKSYRPYATSC
jgi:Flp pilus assembly protein TadD